MRWLCFLLLASPPLASAATGQTAAPPPTPRPNSLQVDVAQVPAERDPEVKPGEISGRRRVGTRSGGVQIVPVSRRFAPGTVFSDYVFLAGAVSNAAPGDSLAVRAYKEFDDSLVTLSFIAEARATIEVPAGRFDVLPLRSGGFRIYATRSGPRRVVKGETLDGAFSFELVQSGPVVPTPE